jgi:hypothetical protein
MTKKRPQVAVRAVTPDDFEAWKPLWDDYNAFYERVGPTALPDEVTDTNLLKGPQGALILLMQPRETRRL